MQKKKQGRKGSKVATLGELGITPREFELRPKEGRAVKPLIDLRPRKGIRARRLEAMQQLKTAAEIRVKAEKELTAIYRECQHVRAEVVVSERESAYDVLVIRCRDCNREWVFEYRKDPQSAPDGCLVPTMTAEQVVAAFFKVPLLAAEEDSATEPTKGA